MVATHSTITNYLPQRKPMVMINDLVEVESELVVTQLYIDADNIFVEDGFFTEPGLVENIAQTAAAQVGYLCTQQNIPVPVGYIAAVKNLKIVALPKQNSTIKTFIRTLHKIMDVTVVEGKVEQEGILLCSCEMKIFVKI